MRVRNSDTFERSEPIYPREREQQLSRSGRCLDAIAQFAVNKSSTGPDSGKVGIDLHCFSPIDMSHGMKLVMTIDKLSNDKDIGFNSLGMLRHSHVSSMTFQVSE